MFHFSSIFTPSGMASLGQIIVGDLTMAGDNVVIMGSLASGLPEKDRKKVLMFGVGMALVFLIGFALLATELLKITGLMSKISNGFISLQVEMANTDNEDRKAFYRVKWLDESGFQVWDDEVWKPVLLHGNQKNNVQVMAPTNKARDFRIQFNAENNYAN